MRVAVDLHMHSCLSPCASDDMTPNNIAGMAMVKGLQLIAVSDHNAAGNLPAVKACADACSVGLLPAIEFTSREEAHILGYFRSVEDALKMGEAARSLLPPIKNKPALFGNQLLMNEDDEVIGSEERLLISALDMDLEDLVAAIRDAGGLAVPAHINRGSNGILNALGFVPPGVPFCALEVSRGLPLPHKGLPDLPVLYSSDAHRLEDMAEPDIILELDAPTPEAFFDRFANFHEILR